MISGTDAGIAHVFGRHALRSESFDPLCMNWLSVGHVYDQASYDLIRVQHLPFSPYVGHIGRLYKRPTKLRL